MKLISTKDKLVLRDFRHVFTEEKKLNYSVLYFSWQSSLPGNKTLNIFRISNFAFINISLKMEPISKFCLSLLDTE